MIPAGNKANRLSSVNYSTKQFIIIIIIIIIIIFIIITFAKNTIAICQKSQETGDFITICKLGSFKNPFAIITSLSEFWFRFKKIILLVQTKKVTSMNYGSSRSGWKLWRWVRLDLIFTMRDYASVPNWIHSNNSLAVAETTILNIILHGTSPKWSYRPPHSAQR